MLDRCSGNAGATETPIGRLPRPEDIDTKGLNVGAEALQALLSVDPSLWKKEAADMRAYFEQYGARMPRELLEELKGLESRVA